MNEIVGRLQSTMRTWLGPVASALLRGFIAKSGGIEKMCSLRDAMRGVPDGKRADFIRGCARTDAGARQLMALAMLGIAVACEYGDDEDRA